MSKNEKGALLKQASILAIAGFITRIIGLLYRSPMNAVIGNLGVGYYGYAFEFYRILLLISSYSIPMALSKVMSERLARREYKNAQKMFHTALIYVVVVGGLSALVLFFGGKYFIAKGQENALLALKMLAPTIFLSGILGVFRGYFQAYNTMMPTSISQIAEQLINAIVSILAAIVLTRPYVGNSEMVAKFGAAGGTIGTGAGVLIGLIFMVFVYRVNKKGIKHKIKKDTSRHLESYPQLLKVLLLMVTPIIFSTFVYNSTGYLDSFVFSNILYLKGGDPTVIGEIYGVFSNQVMTMINIPVAIASAMSATIVPAIAASFAQGDRRGGIERINEGIRFTTFISVPAAVGMGVLGIPLIRLLFPSQDAMVAGPYLTMASISIILSGLSTVTNGILQAIGKSMLTVKNAAISVGVNLAVLTLSLLIYPKMGIIAVILATVVYSLCITVLNALSVRKHLHYTNEIKDAYVVPVICATGMGIIVGLLYFILYKFIPQNYFTNALEVAISMVIGIVVYIVLFIIIGKVSDEDLMKLPAGRYIVKFSRIFRR